MLALYFPYKLFLKKSTYKWKNKIYSTETIPHEKKNIKKLINEEITYVFSPLYHIIPTSWYGDSLKFVGKFTDLRNNVSFPENDINVQLTKA